MYRAAIASIDLRALRHNHLQLRQHSNPQSKIMSVIKANAYGHGMLEVANALDDETNSFAVATMEEGIALRHAGIDKPITVLQGFRNADDLTQCIILKLNPVVHQFWQIKLLEEMDKQTKRNVSVWLKITSGMNRIGFQPEELDKAWQQLKAIQCVEQIKLMTHMARADEQSIAKDSAKNPTRIQIETFNNATLKYQTQNQTIETSIANSATLFDWPEAHADWVRPGIALYGVNPFETGTASDLNLTPVMTLTAPLIAINHHKKGAAIGYGGGFVCPQDMSVGVVQIGYGDGYPRHAKSGTPVLINEQRSPLVGRVSMDSILIDLNNLDANIGDAVTLWGNGLPVEEIATCAETIAYELLCSVYGRVKFQYA